MISGHRGMAPPILPQVFRRKRAFWCGVWWGHLCPPHQGPTKQGPHVLALKDFCATANSKMPRSALKDKTLVAYLFVFNYKPTQLGIDSSIHGHSLVQKCLWEELAKNQQCT